MKNLYEAFYRCVRICEENNIPIANSEEIEVEVNSRAKKRWGLCTKNPNRTFSIQISDRLLKDDVDEAATFNTIIHELLHTCPNCMNHGKQWKIWAEVINRNTKYTIKRTTSCAEKGIAPPPPKPPKYVITCRKCRAKWFYNRAGAVVKNVGRCKCPYCNDYTLIMSC